MLVQRHEHKGSCGLSGQNLRQIMDQQLMMVYIIY